MRPLATLLAVALLGCTGHSSGEGSASGGTGGGGCNPGASGGSGAGIPVVPDAGCADFEPCGGDLEGRWLVREACVTRAEEVTAEIVMRCPESAAAGVALAASGSYEFSSGLLQVSFDVTSTVTVAFTSVCASSLCTDLESLCTEYQASQAGDPQYASVACAVQGDECRCTLLGDPVHQSVVTSYEVMGTQIADASGGRTDFCINENELSTSYFDEEDRVFVGLDRE